MAVPTYRNRLKTAISNTPGTSGAFTIASAASAFLTFTAVDDGLAFDVTVLEGTTWEFRTGCIYTHAGTSLARGTLESSSTGSAIAFTSAAVLTVTPGASFYNNVITQLLGDIDGLEMSWNSGSSISIGTGSAHMEASGNLVRVTSPITVTGLALGANAWGHVYLYNSGGTPGLEVVTTAPDTPYFGTARSKTGDATRRYVGSVATDASGSIRIFQNDALTGGMMYRDAANTSAGYRALSAGTATTSTSVSLAGLLPLTSRLALLKLSNTDTGILSWMISGGDDAAAPSTGNGFFVIAPGVRTSTVCPVNASQTVNYAFASTPAGAAFIDILGYYYKR